MLQSERLVFGEKILVSKIINQVPISFGAFLVRVRIFIEKKIFVVNIKFVI